MKASGIGRLLDSLPREGAMTELCSCKFNVFKHDEELNADAKKLHTFSKSIYSVTL